MPDPALHRTVADMNARFLRTALFALLAFPLAAQIRIGGSACSSASLNGAYSLTLNGVDLSSSGKFTKVLQGIGTATFDGLSNVTLSLPSALQSLTGTYSLNANCTGLIAITDGDTANFMLTSYDSGKAYALSGQDGIYAFSGEGSVLPASCDATALSGNYALQGSGYALSSSFVSDVRTISGVLQFDGMGTITTNWYVASNTANTSATGTGAYTVMPSCTGNAAVVDSTGNTYNLQFTLTGDSGLVISGASPQLMFTGTGNPQTTVPACSNATLRGPFTIVLDGRQINLSGALAATSQAVGSATFDGSGNATFSMAANSNQFRGRLETMAGTYSLDSTCTGTVDIASGDTASFTLIAEGDGQSFTIDGGDGIYALSGGGDAQPSCTTSALAGPYAFSGSGAAFAFGSIVGFDSVSGVLLFDGRGNLTANWTSATKQSGTPVSASGTYSMTAACQGSSTLQDSAGSNWALTFVTTSSTGTALALDLANLLVSFSGHAHVIASDPGAAVVSAASGMAASTPPGSIFSIYGSGLATGAAQATKVPLPTILRSTGVTVNGEAAPLFYVSDGQINAQMPLEIKPGVATIVVRNGSFTSNSVAVVVPAAATPGLFVEYPTNQAVVQNPDLSVNTPMNPARPGDTVVAYFTGGGPVEPAAPLATGAVSPYGESPVSAGAQVTVGGAAATVLYAGLTPTLVGVYQVNFVVPQVASGQQDLTLTINGNASPTTMISVTD